MSSFVIELNAIFHRIKQILNHIVTSQDHIVSSDMDLFVYFRFNKEDLPDSMPCQNRDTFIVSDSKIRFNYMVDSEHCH